MTFTEWGKTWDGRYMRAWCEPSMCYVDVTLADPDAVSIMDEFGQRFDPPLPLETEIKAEATKAFRALGVSP